MTWQRESLLYAGLEAGCEFDQHGCEVEERDVPLKPFLPSLRRPAGPVKLSILESLLNLLKEEPPRRIIRNMITRHAPYI